MAKLDILNLRTKLYNLENEIDRLSKEAEGAYAMLLEGVATALDYDEEFLDMPESRECEDSPTGWCIFDKDRKKYPECLACGRE